MKSIVLILFLSFSAWAQQAFNNLSIIGGTGYWKPLDNLSDVVDDGVYGELGTQFGYYKSISMLVSLAYNQVSSPDLDVNIHLFTGRVGYVYAPMPCAEIGTGVGLYFLRAADPSTRPLLLNDNESDFGTFFAFNLISPSYFKWKFLWANELDVMFTKPDLSYFYKTSFKVAYEVW